MPCQATQPPTASKRPPPPQKKKLSWLNIIADNVWHRLFSPSLLFDDHARGELELKKAEKKALREGKIGKPDVAKENTAIASASNEAITNMP